MRHGAHFRDTRIPVPVLLGRFLLDSGVQQQQQMATLLGIDPLDDPVEVQASAARVRAIRPALGVINLFASSFAVGVTEYLTAVSQDFSRLPQEARETVAQNQAVVAQAVARGSLTQLIDLGFVERRSPS